MNICWTTTSSCIQRKNYVIGFSSFLYVKSNVFCVNQLTSQVPNMMCKCVKLSTCVAAQYKTSLGKHHIRYKLRCVCFVEQCGIIMLSFASVLKEKRLCPIIQQQLNWLAYWWKLHNKTSKQLTRKMYKKSRIFLKFSLIQSCLRQH